MIGPVPWNAEEHLVSEPWETHGAGAKGTWVPEEQSLGWASCRDSWATAPPGAVCAWGCVLRGVVAPQRRCQGHAGIGPVAAGGEQLPRLTADWCLSPVWLFVLSGGQLGYNGQVPVMGFCGPALLLPADA